MERAKRGPSKDRVAKPGRRIKLSDFERQHRLLSALVLKRYKGNWRAAERAVGLPVDALRPFKEKRSDVISERVERGIFKLALRHRSVSLLLAKVSSPQWKVLQHYWRWRDRGCFDHIIRDEPRWEIVDTGVTALPVNDAAEIYARRIGELHYLLGIIQERYPDLLNALRAAYHKYHHEDEDDAAQIPNNAAPAESTLSPQLYHSLIRIAEPLLETRDSGFVERGWEEMLQVELRSKTKRHPLRDFIAAGVEREKILLERDDDWERTRALPTGLLSDASKDWEERIEQKYAAASGGSLQRAMWLHMLNRARGMAQEVKQHLKRRSSAEKLR